MDALQRFLNSSTVNFKSLAYYKEAAINSGAKNFSICTSKKVGSTVFKLNTAKDFGDPNFNFDIVFTGSYIGNDGTGNPKLSWTFEFDFTPNNGSNRYWITVAGVSHELTFKKIEGSLITTLSEKNPLVGTTDCSGNSAISDVDIITTPGTEYTIHILASVTLGAIDVDQDIYLNNVQLDADSRIQTDISATLEVDRNECGVKSNTFYAFVHNVPSGYVVSYLWGVSPPATTLGSNTKYVYKITLNNSPGPFTVLVQVAVTDPVTGFVIFKIPIKTTYFPETPNTLRYKKIYCDVKKLVKRNLFVDPLWDPLRDLNKRPLKDKEIIRMQNLLNVLQKNLSSIKKLNTFDKGKM